MGNETLRRLPNMNALLEHPLLRTQERERVKAAARLLLDSLRATAEAPEALPDLDRCAALVLERLRRERQPSLRGVVNATGVVLHTNLGRAPLGETLYRRAEAVFSGYSNLEYDLSSGTRGSRHAHVERLICELTGAEAALVVNNNAAAVFLMLAALAGGRQVAISRGELVEIGGSFRVPDIMERSGAALYEVGTTNRTRLGDYAAAVDGGARALLKVHTSNYEIVGFTESVSVSALAELARQRGIPLLYDMGSCFLFDPKLPWLREAKTARSGIADGADVVCFSGDKLMGATQAGIAAGRKSMIEAMKKHPLARMLRPDKLTLQALESVLELSRYPEEAKRAVPALRMLSAGEAALRQRAQALAALLREVCPAWKPEAVPVSDETGGGSLPNVEIPGWAVALRPDDRSADALEEALRMGETPVVARIRDGALLLAVRTLMEGDGERILGAVRELRGREIES